MSPESASTRTWFAEQALLPSGWARDVRLTVDAAGDLVAVEAGVAARDATPLGRWVLPGLPNLHSHAFQRAMAGLAERQAAERDTFWSWRETMYRYAAALDPAALHAIAAQLYADLLLHGYTAVCEFHYVHHQPDGRAYAPPRAMCDALVAAAQETGIGLTLLPTLYQTGGFDGRALVARQRRFHHEVDALLALAGSVRAAAGPQLAVGLALHSLRAVPPAALARALASAYAEEGPIHIHVAEQVAEVDECLALRGARPVAWLLDNAAVDSRWCLVHATHVTADEVQALSRSGAVVGLCPTTEANLGDGVFPLRGLLDAGGSFGIGSDSHVSVSPVEELRWLEYGQRLAGLRRNVAADRREPSTGASLWREALVGGAQASGRRIGGLVAGHRADLLVLDDQAPELAARSSGQLLDTLVFAGNRNLVRDVMVGGRWVVRAGAHLAGERIAGRYRQVAQALGDGV